MLLAARDQSVHASVERREALADALLEPSQLAGLAQRRAALEGMLVEVRAQLRELRTRPTSVAILEAAARGQRLRDEQQAIVRQHAEALARSATLEAETARVVALISRHHRARRELDDVVDDTRAIGDRFLQDARQLVIDSLRQTATPPPLPAAARAWFGVVGAVARRSVINLLFESWVRPTGAALVELEREAATIGGFETVTWPAKVRLRCTEARAGIEAFVPLCHHALGAPVDGVVNDWWELLAPNVPRPQAAAFSDLMLPLPGLNVPALEQAAAQIHVDSASARLAAAWASVSDGFDAKTDVLAMLPSAPAPVNNGWLGADDDDLFLAATSAEYDPFGAHRTEAAPRPSPIDFVDVVRPTLAPGTRVGRCVVSGLVGRGGMGEVYRAQLEGDLGFRRAVVLKRLTVEQDDGDALQGFLREAEVAARIAHPNVVQIFDLQIHNNEPFIIMEYLDGLSLQKLAQRQWREGGQINARVLTRCALDVARGLFAAHSMRRDDGNLMGLVHRDVSPDNLFLCRNGFTKLLDFGIARRGDLKTMTGKSELKGKIPYMSPEQILGDPLDARSDLFSLGATLYWLLTGERPFAGDNEISTLYAVVNKAHAPIARRRPDAAALAAVIEALLQKPRDDRPASALEVVDALERAGPASIEETAGWLSTIEDG
jgi:serine/threonine-protein kinase